MNVKTTTSDNTALTIMQRLLIKVGLREDYCWADFMLFIKLYPTMAAKFIGCLLILMTLFLVTVSTVTYAAVKMDYHAMGEYVSESIDELKAVPKQEVLPVPQPKEVGLTRADLLEILGKQNAYMESKSREFEKTADLALRLNTALEKTLDLAKQLESKNKTLSDQIDDLESERLELIAKVKALERRQVEDKKTIAKLKQAEQKLLSDVFN